MICVYSALRVYGLIQFEVFSGIYDLVSGPRPAWAFAVILAIFRRFASCFASALSAFSCQRACNEQRLKFFYKSAFAFQTPYYYGL
jgi:hypothetical protein